MGNIIMVAEYEIIIRLAASVLLGAILGAEREVMNKPAGLRTNALVCMGSCLFTIISISYFTNDYARVAAGIVTGIGFLGAGIMINMGKEVRGITTSATLWTVAAIGMGVGMGAYSISVAATILAFIVLKMRFLEGPLKKMKK